MRRGIALSTARLRLPRLSRIVIRFTITFILLAPICPDIPGAEAECCSVWHALASIKQRVWQRAQGHAQGARLIAGQGMLLAVPGKDASAQHRVRARENLKKNCRPLQVV